MINEIGEIAGKVWQYPSKHLEAAPRDINKTLRSGDPLLFMGVGSWLAREGKVVLKRDGRGVEISLATQ